MQILVCDSGHGKQKLAQIRSLAYVASDANSILTSFAATHFPFQFAEPLAQALPSAAGYRYGPENCPVI